MDKNNEITLKNQLCFPLYVCSREMVKKYSPLLEKAELTYTQYIAMEVLWERKSMTSKEMGTLLHLDSGTLTPLLKKMESKGLLSRCRMPSDERNLLVTITARGEDLKKIVDNVPQEIESQLNLTAKERATLSELLLKLYAGSKD